MKWVIIHIFMMLFVSAFGQIDKMLLKERYWAIDFPCIKDSSVVFGKKIIISVGFSDIQSSLCNQRNLPFIDFSDSENLVLFYSIKEDTTKKNVTPAYTSYAISTTCSEMNGKWKVISDNLLEIILKDYGNPLLFSVDTATYEDRIVLRKKK